VAQLPVVIWSRASSVITCIVETNSRHITSFSNRDHCLLPRHQQAVNSHHFFHKPGNFWAKPLNLPVCTKLEKLATLSQGIWQIGLQNSDSFLAETVVPSLSAILSQCHFAYDRYVLAVLLADVLICTLDYTRSVVVMLCPATQSEERIYVFRSVCYSLVELLEKWTDVVEIMREGSDSILVVIRLIFRIMDHCLGFSTMHAFTRWPHHSRQKVEIFVSFYSCV